MDGSLIRGIFTETFSRLMAVKSEFRIESESVIIIILTLLSENVKNFSSIHSQFICVSKRLWSSNLFENWKLCRDQEDVWQGKRARLGLAGENNEGLSR